MAGLNDLDVTQPDGSIIPVSQLDDFQRQDRSIVKAWALVQHDALGNHVLPIGSTAARTAAIPAPVNGNIWITLSGGVYQLTVYNAGAWHLA